MKGDYIGSFEQMVLAAVKLVPDAYGMTVHAKAEELMAGRRIVSLGAVYTTIDRLEQKGYIESWMGGATKLRGGRSKRYVRLTKAGEAVLQDSIRMTANVVRALGWLERRGLTKFALT